MSLPSEFVSKRACISPTDSAVEIHDQPHVLAESGDET